MAYAAILSLKLTLEQILLHPDRHPNPHERQLMDSLNEKLGFLQQFLEQVSSHQSVETVERRIRDAAYEAEDAVALHQIDPHPLSMDVVAAQNSVGSKFNNHGKETEKNYLLTIGQEIDYIVQEVTKFKEQLEVYTTQESESSVEKETEIDKFHHTDDFDHSLNSSSNLDSSMSKNTMVGFDDYFIRMKDQLTGGPSALKVISIVGMGGIGKTTLAANVYNDSSIAYHFDIHAWTTISQSYCTRGIILGLLGSMKMMTDYMHQESDDRLGHHLYKALKGNRYLIIIDDIWDTDPWDEVRRMFPDDNTGSRIILTTRISKVAAFASTSGFVYQISLLSNDQSWLLLRAKVFGDESCPLDLQETGKKIAQKCQGLPLSVVLIGGLLSKVNMTREAWQNVAQNVTSSVDQCFEILKLSYNYLPHYLRACFLYMGVFPEDHEIPVSKLIKLWVAEGFLNQDQSQSMEEVAERCLNELIERSLILPSKRNSGKRLKTCKIHDLLRDFCVTESNKENFMYVTKRYLSVSPNSLHCLRRISIHPMAILDNLLVSSTPSVSFARSFITIGNHKISSELFLQFKLLRVLDAIQVEFLQFPYEILELLSLRYLAFTCKEDMPASISKLWNLQTLISNQYSSSKQGKFLPFEIWRMPHLRHVKFKKAYLLDPVAVKFNPNETYFVLENLQTLSGIWDLKLTKDVLRKIRNIMKLNIIYDSRRCKEKGWSYYQFENLVNLHKLQALKISLVPGTNWLVNWTLPPLFNFTFPPTLKKLTLRGCGIPWHDLATVGSLPNLEVLKLKDHACLGTTWEPNKGEFRRLQFLLLEDSDLIHWRADSGNFPCLEHLILQWCFKLLEIPSGLGESSTLDTIELNGCKASAFDSAMSILETQQSYGNESFRVVGHSRSNFSYRKMHAFN
ncbi:putative late blight resistance protein homolog R1A-10 [Henckelia pumila]|uniref:putative late blight resistance protein homolog R1A-10 n=1 Tax=Henckelia pumila TaxID=405737 RepID=UPI003C6E928B